MNIYIELLLLSLVVVYIVDLSGWTETWLGWLSKFTARYGYGPVKRLRPFSCSQCMTWWCCLAWALWRGELGLPTIAASAGFALLSITINQFLLFIREGTLVLIGRIARWLNVD